MKNPRLRHHNFIHTVHLFSHEYKHFFGLFKNMEHMFLYNLLRISTLHDGSHIFDKKTYFFFEAKTYLHKLIIISYKNIENNLTSSDKPLSTVCHKTLVFSPFPILTRRPICKTSCKLRILRQTKLGFWPS